MSIYYSIFFIFSYSNEWQLLSESVGFSELFAFSENLLPVVC